MKKKYDIFISYRRESSQDFANFLFSELTKSHYTVFFDISSEEPGQFNEHISSAIEHCRDFILILYPGTLDRCANEGDWVRKEIEYAHEKRKNIIPIRMRDFSWDDDLPNSLEFLKRQQYIEYSPSYTRAFITKLKKFLRTKLFKIFRQASLIFLCATLLLGFASSKKGYSALKAAEGEVCFVLGKTAYKHENKNAFQFLTTAADLGISEAHRIIGDMYLEGTSSEEDSIKAFERFLLASDSGDSNAMVLIGDIYYYENSGVSRDPIKALEWYQKAAEMGNVEGMIRCAQLNLTELREPNYDEAYSWYTKAASSGSVAAMCALGQMYEVGGFGKIDYASAAEWFIRAAYYDDAESMWHLGRFFEYGLGVREDDERALKLYKEASESNLSASYYGRELSRSLERPEEEESFSLKIEEYWNGKPYIKRSVFERTMQRRILYNSVQRRSLYNSVDYESLLQELESEAEAISGETSAITTEEADKMGEEMNRVSEDISSAINTSSIIY